MSLIYTHEIFLKGFFQYTEKSWLSKYNFRLKLVFSLLISSCPIEHFEHFFEKKYKNLQFYSGFEQKFGWCILKRFNSFHVYSRTFGEKTFWKSCQIYKFSWILSKNKIDLFCQSCILRIQRLNEHFEHFLKLFEFFFTFCGLWAKNFRLSC